MGLSAGPEHIDLDGKEFHLEAKGRGIAIWSKDEMQKILMLSAEGARSLADDLMLHAEWLRRPEDDSH